MGRTEEGGRGSGEIGRTAPSLELSGKPTREKGGRGPGGGAGGRKGGEGGSALLRRRGRGLGLREEREASGAEEARGRARGPAPGRARGGEASLPRPCGPRRALGSLGFVCRAGGPKEGRAGSLSPQPPGVLRTGGTGGSGSGGEEGKRERGGKVREAGQVPASWPNPAAQRSVATARVGEAADGFRG